MTYILYNLYNLYQFHDLKALFKVPKLCNKKFWIENDPFPPLVLFRKFIWFGSRTLPLGFWVGTSTMRVTSIKSAENESLSWRQGEAIKIRIVDNSVSSRARTSVIIRRWRWRRRPMPLSREMTLSPADATVGTETDTHVQQQHNTGIHWDTRIITLDSRFNQRNFLKTLVQTKYSFFTFDYRTNPIDDMICAEHGNFEFVHPR